MPTVLEHYRTNGRPPHCDPVQIDGSTGRCENARRVDAPLCRTRGFSLVEVTIALGVAAVCLIVLVGLLPTGLKTQRASSQETIANQIANVILSDLRADLRLPPGQESHEGESGFGLHGHWAQMYAPDTLYFDQQGVWLQLNGNAPPAATFRAKITYYFPPTSSTSVATVVITWPAQVDPSAVTPAGSVQTFIAVNR